MASKQLQKRAKCQPCVVMHFFSQKRNRNMKRKKGWKFSLSPPLWFSQSVTSNAFSNVQKGTITSFIIQRFFHTFFWGKKLYCRSQPCSSTAIEIRSQVSLFLGLCHTHDGKYHFMAANIAVKIHILTLDI